jgi:pimeloyl-ACP methyl ester carboxylesterase
LQELPTPNPELDDGGVPAGESAIVRARENLHVASLPAGDIRYLRAGTGTPTMLLHTLRTQLEYFGPLLGQLDTARFEVVAIDLPGHGESSAPRAEYTANYFTDAIEQVLDHCELRDAIVVGESIGASIALALAARGNPRVRSVIALNPYDYGRRGGIRRSSALANVVFTAMLFPAIGPVVANVGSEHVLRRIMAGGVYDRRALPDDLIADLHRCGSLPGHARAFRSLMRNWRSWIDARASYRRIEVPVTLSYGAWDWSRPAERDADALAIPGARTGTLPDAGHFSSLERPREIAKLIGEAA